MLTVGLEDAAGKYGEVTLAEREDHKPFTSADAQMVEGSARTIAGVLRVMRVPLQENEEPVWQRFSR